MRKAYVLIDAEAVAKMVLNEIAVIEGVVRTTTCLVVSGRTGAGQSASKGLD